jgi:hypothetical protein
VAVHDVDVLGIEGTAVVVLKDAIGAEDPTASYVGPRPMCNADAR